MRELRRKKLQRRRRRFRSRKNVFGSTERPRMTVYRSDRHIYCQFIDDTNGRTLFGLSSLSPALRGEVGANCGNKEGAARVGEEAARKALEQGIKRVCFDRNGYRFHGRVKALADSARKQGLQF